MRYVVALLPDHRGSSAFEFALVLPLLLLLLFGILDVGRFAWESNQAEKATQMGARLAVVADVVNGDLVAYSFVGNGGLTAGDPIPASALGSVKCTSVSCTCAVVPCPALGGYNAQAFTDIVTRMQLMKPDIAATNVELYYSGSGLGFAGDPEGMDVSPLVTVKLTGLTFRPTATLMFKNFAMPAFATTLTAEDSVGRQSN